MTYDPGEAKSIFLQALELTTPDERSAFLEQQCAGRPELRVRVENLLQAMSEPDSLIDSPAGEIDGTQLDAGGSHPASFDFLEGRNGDGTLGRIGAYDVLEVIGRGGMGIVLRAIDSKLNRVVAIKVLTPELANNPQARRRFLREAQAAAAVSHDHVVTIHGVDEGRDGGRKPPFLVMECISGQSLQQKIDKVGALGLKEILRIGMQIAWGLAAAHKQGLVHRDIKPANILLENGIERVKITDFGLARATDDVGITQTGQIAGTPQYMSPEQAMGQPVDQRSDLFSLGSVLYTMCTGRPAFRADSAVVILRRVCDDTPRPIQEVNAEIPAWLATIVDRLMSKKPEDRFQTANEVAALLEKCLAHIQQPETTLMPEMVHAPRPDNTATVSPQSIMGTAWQAWWSERDRWVTVSAQTVLILAYLVCMVCFISFGLKTSLDSEGRSQFTYKLGAPGPWFMFEVYPEPLVPFRFGFHPWSSSVLVGLLGCLLYYIYWRIELVRDPRTPRWGSPTYMLGFWGVGAACAVLLGNWMGHDALSRPRVAVTKPPSPITYPPGTLTLPTPDGKPFDLWKEAAKIAQAEEERDARWVDLLKSPEVKRFAETARGVRLEDGALVLSSPGDGQSAQLWVDSIKLRRGRMRIRVQSLNRQPQGAVGLAWDPGSGSPRRLEAVLGNPDGGKPVASLWQYDQDFNVHALADKRVDVDWSQPFVMQHDLRDGASTAHVAGIDFAAEKGLDPTRPAIPFLGAVNSTWKVLEWKVMNLDPTPPAPAVAPFDATQAKAHQAAWAKHLGVPVEHTNSIGMKFQLIPPGEFAMGSPPAEIEAALDNIQRHAPDRADWQQFVQSEAPRHAVILTKAFYLGSHEVTQQDYKAVMGNNPSSFAHTGKIQEFVQKAAQLNTTTFAVENVSWCDAAEFCAKLSQQENLKPNHFREGPTVTQLQGTGYLLPTEAQWEFACRAGTTTAFSSGDGGNSVLQSVAWFWLNAGQRMHPVGELQANPFGLFDMHGNASEWVQDAWGAGYYDQFKDTPAQDPTGASPGQEERILRIIRGGLWMSAALDCRSGSRFANDHRGGNQHTGFRVVLPLEAVQQSTNVATPK